MFTDDRQQTRAVFFRAWQRHRQRLPLEGIENIIVAVALRHPEYHALLENPDAHEDRDYPPESGRVNPFLHLGLHVAIEEQLSVDRPPGVRECYLALLKQFSDEHAAQHRMLDCLGEMLWRAERERTAPSETHYLDCLRRAAREQC
ncbi:MAG: DUF1841 family protein [Gammaproteobacteria bacterium]|nr:DUF1841 family protein [Gammaproteobacteria bacterium]